MASRASAVSNESEITSGVASMSVSRVGNNYHRQGYPYQAPEDRRVCCFRCAPAHFQQGTCYKGTIGFGAYGKSARHWLNYFTPDMASSALANTSRDVSTDSPHAEILHEMLGALVPGLPVGRYAPVCPNGLRRPTINFSCRWITVISSLSVKVVDVFSGSQGMLHDP